MSYKKNIILAGVLVFSAVAAAGAYFALRKSEPVYLSKADRIMFESENKSPKYVITMPDKEKSKPAVVKKEDTKKEEEEKEIFSLENLMTNIPNLSKLTPIGDAVIPLRYISPNYDLVEAVGNLKLPKINDGKKPWVEYGRKVVVLPNFYKVAVVIKELGTDVNTTGVVSQKMPSNISLSFSPYSPNLSEQIKEARKYGHETYVDLLLASEDFLREDTGPKAIGGTGGTEETMQKFREIIGVNAPIGGIIINRGDAGENNVEHIRNALENAKERGLLVLDATSNDGVSKIQVSGLAREKADIVIESGFNKKRIKGLLKEAEIIARNAGQVLIIADPKPLVILEIREWVDGFSPQLPYEELIKDGGDLSQIEKPFALVPASAVVAE